MNTSSAGDDICGQFYDLMELFRVDDNCPETNYVFLGDFVDLRFYSVETFQLFLTLKVKPLHFPSVFITFPWCAIQIAPR